MITALFLRRFAAARTSGLMAAALAVSLFACSDADILEPDPGIAFLVGDWQASQMVLVNLADTTQAPDLVETLGADFTLNVQPSGQYTATIVFAQQPSTEMGTLDVEGGEIVFSREFPPPAETSRSAFTIAGDRLTLVGPSEFDFNQDGEPEPVRAEMILLRQ